MNVKIHNALNRTEQHSWRINVATVRSKSEAVTGDRARLRNGKRENHIFGDGVRCATQSYKKNFFFFIVIFIIFESFSYHSREYRCNILQQTFLDTI